MELKWKQWRGTVFSSHSEGSDFRQENPGLCECSPPPKTLVRRTCTGGAACDPHPLDQEVNMWMKRHQQQGLVTAGIGFKFCIGISKPSFVLCRARMQRYPRNIGGYDHFWLHFLAAFVWLQLFIERLC